IELHRLDFRIAGNLPDQSWEGAPTVWTGAVDQSAIDEVAGAVAQHDAAASIQRREDQFAGFAFGDGNAGLGINDFEEAEIGIEGAAARRFVDGEGALGTGQLAFGKAEGGEDIASVRAELGLEIKQLASEVLGGLLTTADT